MKVQELVVRRKDRDDARLRLVELTDRGSELLEELVPVAREITGETLAPSSKSDASMLLEQLGQIAEDEPGRGSLIDLLDTDCLCTYGLR